MWKNVQVNRVDLFMEDAYRSFAFDSNPLRLMGNASAYVHGIPMNMRTSDFGSEIGVPNQDKCKDLNPRK